MDPLLDAAGITDGELRLTKHHIDATIASLDHAYHFSSASEQLRERIRVALMTVEHIGVDIAACRRGLAAAPRVYPPADATVTRSPDGQHHEGRWSGPLRNAQNIPKSP